MKNNLPSETQERQILTIITLLKAKKKKLGIL